MKKLTVMMIVVFLWALMGCGIGTGDNTGSNPVETGRETGTVPAGTEDAGLPTESSGMPDLSGPWHLDPDRNDLTAFPDAFAGYAEFGAILEIGSDGQLRWQIGAEGGDGTFTAEGTALTAELVRTVDGSPVSTVFDILRDGDEVYLGMHWGDQTIYWIWGDDGSTDLSGD